MTLNQILSPTVVTCCTLLVHLEQSKASVVTFVPPNDTVGQVFTTNSNDIWDGGRGIVFTVDAPTIATSVGLYQDLTATNLAFSLSEVTNLSGTVAPVISTLASGSSTVSTSGLEFIDYAVPSVSLLPGNNYHLEFSFSGLSNQNFFYNNGNVAWSQDGFSSLEGTQGGSTSNFVVAAFRIDTSAIPEPSGVLSLAFLLSGVALMRNRR